MEKANVTGKIQAARFISIAPQVLKEIANKMEFESQHASSSKKKITFQLTEDIVLFFDPEGQTSADIIRQAAEVRGDSRFSRSCESTQMQN